jgi:hypothetical protein
VVLRAVGFATGSRLLVPEFDDVFEGRTLVADRRDFLTDCRVHDHGDGVAVRESVPKRVRPEQDGERYGYRPEFPVREVGDRVRRLL